MCNNEYCGVLVLLTYVKLLIFWYIHDILLYKFKLHNVDNNALLWFQSYSTDREQTVKINFTFSDELTTKYGVP